MEPAPANTTEEVVILVLAGLAACVVLGVVLYLGRRIFVPWMRCLLAGAPVSPLSLLAMAVRGSPVGLVVDAHVGLKLINPQRDGKVVTVRIQDVESKYLASPGKYLTVRDLMQAMLDDPRQGSVVSVYGRQD
jgi:hypothetical protein